MGQDIGQQLDNDTPSALYPSEYVGGAVGKFPRHAVEPLTRLPAGLRLQGGLDVGQKIHDQGRDGTTTAVITLFMTRANGGGFAPGPRECWTNDDRLNWLIGIHRVDVRIDD
jgi:hypothetical protein